MIPSRQNHSWLLLYVFLILLLHSTGIGGTKITIANRCSEPIWPVVVDNTNSNKEKSAEYEVLQTGSSMALERESGWNGRVWGKTGCLLNNKSGSGSASCVSGDTTEFSPDFYDVSLVNGYNLPVVVKPIPIDGSGCEAAGCPPELRTKGGAACQIAVRMGRPLVDPPPTLRCSRGPVPELIVTPMMIQLASSHATAPLLNISSPSVRLFPSRDASCLPAQ